MSEVYIKADPKTHVITFIHKRPFDPVQGMGLSRDELLKTGYLVDNYPEPKTTVGKRAVAYYDHEKKSVYYEYSVIPFSAEKRQDMVENLLNEFLMSMSNEPNTASEVPAVAALSLTNDNADTANTNSELAKYLAYQIYQHKLDKETVYFTYSQYKNEIESYLYEWDPTMDFDEDDPK